MTWERQEGRAAGDHDRARLKTLDVFASLSDAELQQILSLAIWRHYESGQLIDRPVRDGGVEGIVVEGGVRLLRISETGRVLTEREVGGSAFRLWFSARSLHQRVQRETTWEESPGASPRRMLGSGVSACILPPQPPVATR